jgi:hypothetical protein
MTASPKMLRANLGLETLETRLTPAAVSASYSASQNMIFVNGDNNASNVSITQSGLTVSVNDSANGFSYSKTFASTTELNAAKLQFVGGASADRVVMYAPNLALNAWGYGGNDYLEGYNAADILVGGNGDDILRGYGGNDQMWGEAGNDDLYGMAGIDSLYGGANSDFLDAGSASGETVSGGDGYDFNAYVTAINGTQRNDIHQGGGPTCWLLSSLSAVASRVNMEGRISYQGYGSYRVQLFTETGGTIYQWVNFTGERNNADPNFNPNQEGESWAVIMQRAILQEMGLSTTSPPGGNPFYALPYLTGRSSSWYGAPSAATGLMFLNPDAETMISALANGQYVAMCTWAEGTPLATSKLVNWHCYDVVSVTRTVSWVGFLPSYDYSVVVRNPHGYDNGSGSGDTSDALITLSWAEFAGSLSGYAIN